MGPLAGLKVRLMKLADQHFASVTTALQSREQRSAIPEPSRVAAHQKTALC